MDTETSSVNFSQFSAKVYEKHGNNAGRILKNLCVNKSVIKPSELFDYVQQQWQELSTSERSLCSSSQEALVADFADLCKSYEEYPSNLRKVPPKRRGELQRANSTMLRGVGIDLEPDLHHSMSANITQLDMQRSAAQLYNDYHRFQTKLKKISDQAAAKNEDEKVYQEKIKRIQGFAQHMNRLMPKEEMDCSNALTANEVEILKTVADNLEQLNYLHSQENVRLLRDAFSGDLEALVDILSNTLIQISCFK